MNTMNILRLGAMFVIPFVVVLIPILIGQRYGIIRSSKMSEQQQTPVGSVVGAAFGLLAFMLAFTFQIASNRYDARKALLLEEVTSIRTAWLRAELIPDPLRTDTRDLLNEYVNLRIDLDQHPSHLESALKRSQEILDTLWGYARALAEEDRSSEVYALYTTSVNDLFDNFNHRVTMTLEYRIPSTVIWILFFVSFFSMLILGYQFGISGKENLTVNLILATIFALVMFLILVLDHPETGLSRINQKPMQKLHEQLKSK